MKTLSRFFKKFDIFGAPITFRLKGESDFTSPCGGFIFLLWGGIALAYIIYSFIGFVARENMTLISTYKVKDSPETINFTETRLSIGLGVLFDNNTSVFGIMPDYFDYKFTLNTIYNATNKERTVIPLANCTRDYFSGGSSEIYQSLNIDNSLCPTPEFRDKLMITAKFGDPIFSYFQILVSIKPQYLEKQQEIWKYLTSFPVKVAVYYQDTSMYYDDFYQPLDKYISTYLEYLSADKLIKTDLYFSKIEFGTDQHLFLPNMVSEYDSIFESSRSYQMNMVDRKAISTIHSEYLDLAKFYFRSSNKFIIYQRSYQKLPDFVANLSGILAEFLFYISLVIGSFNESFLLKYMVNKSIKYKYSKYLNVGKVIGIYQDNHNNIISSPKERIETDECLKNNGENIDKDKIVIELNNIEDRSKNEGKKENLEAINVNFENSKPFESQLGKYNFNKNLSLASDKQPIKPNLKFDRTTPNSNSDRRLNNYDTLWYKFCCCKPKSKEGEIRSKILQNGEDYILNSLDIRVYLKKLQSADIMRYIILNEKQKPIYDFLSNPLVLSEDSESEVNKELSGYYSYKNFNSENEIMSLFENYQYLVREKEKSYKDAALLKLFESEMEFLNKTN